MGLRRFKKKRSLSIGSRVLISHVILCIVVIALASLLSYALFAQYIRQTRIADLLEKADKIAETSQETPEGEIKPRRRTVRVYESLTDSRVFFLESDDESIRVSLHYLDSNLKPAEGDKPSEPSGGKSTPEPPQPTQGPAAEGEEDLQWVEVRDSIDLEFAGRILAGEKVSAIRHFEFVQAEIIFAGVPIVDDSGAVRGGVILAQPVAELHSLSKIVRYMLVVVVSASLLLAVILALQLSRVLVSPIQRITRAARRMEDGIYAERITQLPDDEIGELGHALNSMSGRLMDVIRNLRKERDKLELVISGIGEGLIAIDIRWNIVHANAAFLELAEVDHASRVLESGEGSKSFEPLRDLFASCMRTGLEKSLEWENASHRAIHIGARALKDENGLILGAVCLMRDVSEFQRLEQLRRDYVANISHELRTPLTGIRGMVEPLIDGCMDTEEERLDSYRIILKETIRLEKLVGEMLDMSRLQDGRLKVELELLELPGILDAAARSMASIADEAGVALRVETDGSKLACMGNEDRIMQVLVILIDNALSFTPQGGQVVVFARDGADCVYAGVRDNGCGIEPKDLPFIWERFYKADKSRMRTTGTGLGLSIAKLVTELMGGDISVKSEPGEGAEFTFTLKKPRLLPAAKKAKKS